MYHLKLGLIIVIIYAKKDVIGFNIKACKTVAITNNHQSWGYRFHCTSDDATTECRISENKLDGTKYCRFTKEYIAKYHGYNLVKKECNAIYNDRFYFRIEHDVTMEGNQCILDVKDVDISGSSYKSFSTYVFVSLYQVNKYKSKIIVI